MSGPKVFVEGYWNYATSMQEAQHLDSWLERKYGIVCLEKPDEVRAMRGNGRPRKEVLEFDRLDFLASEEADETGTIQPQLALDMTNLLAGHGWREWWHSRRRAWIMDSISLTSAVVQDMRTRQACETLLDVGCNVGFLPAFMAETQSLTTTGLDLAEKSIAEARSLASTRSVEFVAESITSWKPKSRWDIVSAVDLVQPCEPGYREITRAVSQLVRDRGYLVVVANLLDDSKVLDLYRELGFSCLGMQLTGGFQQGKGNGVDWSCKAGLVLIKEKGVDLVQIPISSMMGSFADYANSGTWPPRELNRSHFHARLQGRTST